MQSVEFTLRERAGRMFRLLLILQRVFHEPPQEDSDWIGDDEHARNTALRAAIKEILDDLGEHAGILMSTPFPIAEWRPGDPPDDERWRALTEIERRELLALMGEYADLITWSETSWAALNQGERAAAGGQSVAFHPAGRPVGPHIHNALDYLQAHRTQLERFRKELAFLERRRAR